MTIVSSFENLEVVIGYVFMMMANEPHDLVRQLVGGEKIRSRLWMHDQGAQCANTGPRAAAIL